MDSWHVWANGVLGGIGAPESATNIDTLWAWSGAESGSDRMRINNPLNTTQPEGPGTRDFNSVGVKIYPTVQIGINATVTTLLNGYYPLIVDHLRHSTPRQQWGDACRELGTWGTGCGWLADDYGAAPGHAVEGGGDVNLEEKRSWVRLSYVAVLGRQPESEGVLAGWASQIADDGTGLEHVVNEIITGSEATAHMAAVAKAIADVDAPSVAGLVPHTHTITGEAGPAAPMA